jgi:hypothetical protein
MPAMAGGWGGGQLEPVEAGAIWVETKTKSYVDRLESLRRSQFELTTGFDSMFTFLHEKYFPRVAFGPIYLSEKEIIAFALPDHLGAS